MNFLVTAGPTREPLDPVRFLSNRSTGRMGYAVAAAARARGHAVELVSGPVALAPPEGVTVTRVTTAGEMCAAVEERLGASDVLVMVAAVADWRPAAPSTRKLKKHEMRPLLRLEPTPDILARVRDRKGHRLFVGFAAETGNPEAEAQRKLRAKGLDLIVANDVSEAGSGFEVDTNQVVMITPDARPQRLPRLTKQDVAVRIVEWIEHAKATRKGG
jgi:phosphopantothenoylcysteine decarboxylase/phosphopantothenate--cysteine ligase